MKTKLYLIIIRPNHTCQVLFRTQSRPKRTAHLLRDRDSILNNYVAISNLDGRFAHLSNTLGLFFVDMRRSQSPRFVFGSIPVYNCASLIFDCSNDEIADRFNHSKAVTS